MAHLKEMKEHKVLKPESWHQDEQDCYSREEYDHYGNQPGKIISGWFYLFICFLIIIIIVYFFSI